MLGWVERRANQTYDRHGDVRNRVFAKNPVSGGRISIVIRKWRRYCQQNSVSRRGRKSIKKARRLGFLPQLLIDITPTMAKIWQNSKTETKKST